MIKIEEAVRMSCGSLGLGYEDIMSPRQTAQLWRARYMIWHYLHYSMGMSSGNIAKKFSRARGSIFRGIRLIKHQLKFDKKVRDDYYRICEAMEGATD